MVKPIDKLVYQIQSVLPMVYDDSLSLYELVNKVVVKLNEVIDTSNTYFSQSIETVVTNILTEWDENGHLDTIINEQIFQDINTRLASSESNIGAINTSITALDTAITSMDTDILALDRNKIELDDLPVILPETFGAVGNYDTTTKTGNDDSVALQTAIDTAANQNGVVLLDRKNYYASNLQLRPNVKIKGQGSGATRIYCVNNGESIFHNHAYEVLVDTSIEGMWLDGNGDLAEWGLELKRFTNNSFVRDVHIKDCKNGMKLDEIWYANFSNMHIEWNLGTGILLSDENLKAINGVNFTNVYLNYNNLNVESNCSAYAITWNGCTFEHANWEGVKLTKYPSGWEFNGCYFEKNGLKSAQPRNLFVNANYDGEGSVSVNGGYMQISSDGIGIDVEVARTLNVSGVHFGWDGVGAKPRRLIRSGASVNNILGYSKTFGTLSTEEFELTNPDGVYLWNKQGEVRTNMLTADQTIKYYSKTVTGEYDFSTMGDTPILLCNGTSSFNVRNRTPSACKYRKYYVQNINGTAYACVLGGLGGRTYYYLRNKGDYVEYFSDGANFHVISSNVSGA